MATRTKEFWLRPGERARSTVSDIEPWLFMKYSDENTSNPRIFTGDDFPTSPDPRELIVYAHKRIHVKFNLDPHMIISSYPEWILPGQSFTVTVACTDDTYTFYGWGDRGSYEPDYRTRTFTGPSDWSDIEVDVKEHKKIHVNITAEDGAEIVNEYPEWIVLHDFFNVEARMVDEDRYIWDNWSDGNTNFVRLVSAPDSWDDIELVAQTKQKIHLVLTAEEGLEIDPADYKEWLLPGESVTVTAKVVLESVAFWKWSDEPEGMWPPSSPTRTFTAGDDWQDIYCEAQREALVHLVVKCKHEDGSPSAIPDSARWVPRGQSQAIRAELTALPTEGVAEAIHYWEDEPGTIIDDYRAFRYISIPWFGPEFEEIVYTAIVTNYYWIDAKDQYPEHTKDFDYPSPYVCNVDGIDWYKENTTCTLTASDKTREESIWYAAYFEKWEDGDTNLSKDFLVTGPDTKIIYCKEEFDVTPLACAVDATYQRTIAKDCYHIEGAGWYWYGETATFKYVMDQRGPKEQTICKFWTDYDGAQTEGDTLTVEVKGCADWQLRHVTPQVEFQYKVPCEVVLEQPLLEGHVSVEFEGVDEWQAPTGTWGSSYAMHDTIRLGATVTSEYTPSTSTLPYIGWYSQQDGGDWRFQDRWTPTYPASTQLPGGGAHSMDDPYEDFSYQLRLRFFAPLIYIENSLEESTGTDSHYDLLAYEIYPAQNELRQVGEVVHVTCRVYLQHNGGTGPGGMGEARIWRRSNNNWDTAAIVQTDGHDGWYECSYDYTVQNTAEDHTIWFSTNCKYTPVETHQLTLEGEHCTLVGAGIYVPGDVVSISCTPDEGYKFVQWSDGDTNATRTITMGEEDIHLVATCEEDLFPTLTVNNSMEDRESLTFGRCDAYILSPATTTQYNPGDVVHCTMMFKHIRNSGTLARTAKYTISVDGEVVATKSMSAGGQGVLEWDLTMDKSHTITFETTAGFTAITPGGWVINDGCTYEGKPVYVNLCEEPSDSKFGKWFAEGTEISSSTTFQGKTETAGLQGGMCQVLVDGTVVNSRRLDNNTTYKIMLSWQTTMGTSDIHVSQTFEGSLVP